MARFERRAAGLLLAVATALALPAQAATLEEADLAVRQRRFGDAAAIWRELAKRGQPEAQYHLGALYRSGRGVELDLATAVVWFRRAAEAGHPKAQYNLATMYQNGLGVEIDRERALHW